MSEREPKLMVATGQKGVGKTYTTIQDINPYMTSIPALGKVGRKVLIYDANMEYEDYLAIGLDNLRKFTMQKRVECRRVMPRLEDGSIAKTDGLMEIMNVILERYAGGLLILEDINKYLIGTQAHEIIGTLATNRHRDLDIYIHLQSLAAVTTRMWQNCSVIRLHKQQDNIDTYKGRIPYYEQLKIAELLVNTQYSNGNERFYCFVSAEEQYIRGQFTSASLRGACENYVEMYSKELTVVAKRYAKGQEGRMKAIKYLSDELFKKYNR